MSKALSQLWQRLLYLRRRFSSDRCSESAAALTYMSLFALVPLMTVMVAMVAAIPTFEGVGTQVQDFLFTHLVPASSAEIQSYLEDFSAQAKNLTGLGIGFLIITAILMLRSIEKAFNAIWRAPQHRGGVASFFLYWAVLHLALLVEPAAQD